MIGNRRESENPEILAQQNLMKNITTTYINRVHDEVISSASLPAYDGILGGTLGLSWYYFQLYKFNSNEAAGDKAVELISTVLRNLKTTPKLVGASYGNGVAGLGYVLAQYQKENFLNINLDTEFADYDEYLFEAATEWIEKRNLDFLHGALGIVHYFLERLDNPKIKAWTSVLLQLMIEQAEIDTKGLRILSILSEQGDKKQANFGLSQGMPAFLILLMKASDAGIHIPDVENIVEAGVRFILRFQQTPDLENGEHSFFPLSVNTNDFTANYSNRLAWCYGDINIVWLLYHAADFLNNKPFEELADLIGKYTVSREDEVSTLAENAHFCYGTSGLMQFYLALYQKTGIAAYQTAQLYWTDKTIASIDSHLRLGMLSERKTDLLEGWVGINLALLSHVTDQYPLWSKMLLL